MKKAIITFGVGYSFEDIRYFIQSCQTNTPDADLYIFVGSNIRELRTQCSDFPKVHLIRYHEPLLAKVFTKILKRSRPTAVGLAKTLRSLSRVNWIPSTIIDAFTLPLVQFMVKRFFLIKQLMAKMPHEQIMLSDIRDVLVLSDPFQFVTKTSIQCGEEPVSIENSEMNSRWIMKTYGEEIHEVLKGLPVLCAGVTIGSRKAIDQYVQEMITETYNQLPNIIDMLGADQATHTKLFYMGMHGLQKQLEKNGTGAIATLHFSPLSEFRFADGTMKNKSGKSLAVVHQYDRHAELTYYLKELILNYGRPEKNLAA